MPQNSGTQDTRDTLDVIDRIGLDRIGQDRAEQLEGTNKDHPVQLSDHFRDNRKLKHVIESATQTSLQL